MDLTTTILFILASVTLNSFAQITWKNSLNKLSKKTSLVKTMLKPRVIMGLMMFGFSALIWILVLSNAEVTYAFPFLSLGYVMTTMLSYLILKEKISKQRVAGVTVIIMGVIIVGLSL